MNKRQITKNITITAMNTPASTEPITAPEDDPLELPSSLLLLLLVPSTKQTQ